MTPRYLHVSNVLAPPIPAADRSRLPGNERASFGGVAKEVLSVWVERPASAVMKGCFDPLCVLLGNSV